MSNENTNAKHFAFTKFTHPLFYLAPDTHPSFWATYTFCHSSQSSWVEQHTHDYPYPAILSGVIYASIKDCIVVTVCTQFPLKMTDTITKQQLMVNLCNLTHNVKNFKTQILVNCNENKKSHAFAWLFSRLRKLEYCLLRNYFVGFQKLE